MSLMLQTNQWSHRKIRFVAGYQGWEKENIRCESCQKIVTSSYDINMFYGFNTSHTLLFMLYVYVRIWKLLTVNFKSSHHKEKVFFSLLCIFIEWLDAHSTYCDHHSHDINQLIMLYILKFIQSCTPIVSQSNWRKRKI